MDDNFYVALNAICIDLTKDSKAKANEIDSLKDYLWFHVFATKSLRVGRYSISGISIYKGLDIIGRFPAHWNFTIAGRTLYLADCSVSKRFQTYIYVT